MKDFVTVLDVYTAMSTRVDGIKRGRKTDHNSNQKKSHREINTAHVYKTSIQGKS